MTHTMTTPYITKAVGMLPGQMPERKITRLAAHMAMVHQNQCSILVQRGIFSMAQTLGTITVDVEKLPEVAKKLAQAQKLHDIAKAILNVLNLGYDIQHDSAIHKELKKMARQEGWDD